MSEPEIVRRCLACGAVTRERAFFCSECGRELGKEFAETDGASSATEATSTVNNEVSDFTAAHFVVGPPSYEVDEPPANSSPVETSSEGRDGIQEGVGYDLTGPDLAIESPEEKPSDQILSPEGAETFNEKDESLQTDGVQEFNQPDFVIASPSEKATAPLSSREPETRKLVSNRKTPTPPSAFRDWEDTNPVVTQTGQQKTDQPEGSFGSTAVAQARDKIHRATVTVREIEGDVLHRVEKIRHISTVVLDEAAYDPSLRFLLVAGALFVLFLIIVILNNLFG